MDKHDNLVVGLTHIDLGWKKGRAEMAAMLDIYLEHLCNMLDTYPDFRYVLEQAVHYKDLKTRNLQLFERVKAYLCTGRLEFATGLASTIENNVVCAESFVRNMQIGLRWIKENFGVSVKYCTSLDTISFWPTAWGDIIGKNACPYGDWIIRRFGFLAGIWYLPM